MGVTHIIESGVNIVMSIHRISIVHSLYHRSSTPTILFLNCSQQNFIGCLTSLFVVCLWARWIMPLMMLLLLLLLSLKISIPSTRESSTLSELVGLLKVLGHESIGLPCGWGPCFKRRWLIFVWYNIAFLQWPSIGMLILLLVLLLVLTVQWLFSKTLKQSSKNSHHN